MLYIIYMIIFLYGIVIGSFLNVCIYRIPKQENIVSKRSHCMTCGNVLKWYELVPLFSFLFQRGRCRSCGVKLSKQYPAVEFFNGFLYVLVFAVHGLCIESILFCLCVSTLIVITMIDWRTYEIPIGCNLAIFVLGIIRLAFDPAHWLNYVLGFFAVSIFFYIIFLLSKGRAIGGGDIKLMAAAGLFIGLGNIILAMVIGCIAGAVIHSILMKWKKKERVLAFGPYLAAGILIAMLWGEPIVTWYLNLFL